VALEEAGGVEEDGVAEEVGAVGVAGEAVVRTAAGAEARGAPTVAPADMGAMVEALVATAVLAASTARTTLVGTVAMPARALFTVASLQPAQQFSQTSRPG
jgi:hypothetical protein